jgi:hypothetical protein
LAFAIITTCSANYYTLITLVDLLNFSLVYLPRQRSCLAIGNIDSSYLAFRLVVYLLGKIKSIISCRDVVSATHLTLRAASILACYNSVEFSRKE